MTKKNQNSEDFLKVCTTLRDHKSNKRVSIKRKHIRIVRIKRGDN